MTKVDQELVVKVANLAGLELAPAELAYAAEHLGRVLSYVDELKGLGERLAAAGAKAPRADAAALAEGQLERPDVLAPSLPPSAALANAPKAEGTAFVVPRIIE